ncbi:MAG: MFS transporter [Chloroflexi bacterium]|nr:MFS transporter [Chloroflexota bacterium]
MLSHPQSTGYKWLVLGVTSVGVLMVAIDSTVVVLASPDIMSDLHSNLVSMVWVLMSYIFVSTIFLLGLGRVADMYGRVRLYTIGFAVFTIGSAFCGFAQNDFQLIAARVIQGTGGGMLIVNSLAIITETFPANQRGTAMGINSAVWGTGTIVGPVLGGVILAITSWRWIFLINVPIGITGTALAFLYLRDISKRKKDEKLDIVGAAAFTVCLFSLLFALTQGIEFGWASPPILGVFAVFAGMLVFLLFWESWVEYPALDVKLFRSRLYDFSVSAATLQSLAMFASQFLIVFYLQAARGFSPLSAALLLLPMSITNAIAGPFGGRISDRIGPGVPSSIGLVLQAASLFVLSTVTMQSSYVYIAAGLMLQGIGGGLFWAPNTSAAMGAAPKARLGIAAGTLATLRNTGMVASYALSLAIAAGTLPREVMLQLFVGTAVGSGSPLMADFVFGMQIAFRVSVVICLIAAVLSLVRDGRKRVVESAGR